MKAEIVASPEQNLTLERLKSLYELIGRMNSVYELQELLDFIIDRALSLTGGRRAVLLLNDDADDAPTKVAAVKGQELEASDLERILNFISTTVTSDVMEKGEPRLVTDLSTDERFESLASRDTLQYKRVRSVLAVPLIVEHELVGLVYIDHPKKNIFGQGDLDFLSAFANQAALAIHRASEHQRQIEELTLLNELSRSVVQALDLNEVLTRIVSEVTQILNVETSSVLLLDDESSELLFATSVSNGKPVEISTRLKKDQGVAGWVITHGKPACVNNVAEDSRWFGEVETGFVTQSLVCVPLKMDGPALGVLEALNKQSPNGFDDGDIALLSAFAASATIAIENARLFLEARQARQLRALNEVAINLSSTLELTTILDDGLEQTLQILKAEAGAINMIDDQTQTDLLSVRLGPDYSSANNSEKNELQTQALSSLVSWMLSQDSNEFFTDETFVIDTSHPAQMLGGVELTSSGITAMAAAPIKVSGNVSGVIAIVNTQPHLFMLEEISLLSGIARIIGLAAQNALHYLQMQAQTLHLTYLNEVGSMLTSSLDIDFVLKVIIEGVNSLLQTELTSIFLIDEETNELVLRYSTKEDTDIRLPWPWQGIAGWVAKNDQPALVNDTESDPRHLRQIAIETGYETHSILCVPLKVEGQVIGVVEVLNKMGSQPFTQYHQTLLIGLTKWAAIALHNASLFNERKQAYERLNAEQERRIAAETRGAMAAIILDMAHTMNNIVGAIRVWALALEGAADSNSQKPVVEFEKPIRQIRQNAEEAIKLMSTMTGPLVKADLTPTDVNKCLKAAIKSCWWPDNIHLETVFGERLPFVKANSERLETVFHNLLSNSVQAMTPVGGGIQVKTRRNQAKQIQVIITDNGPGIPQELQDRVFNPGVSGKNSLGIGLWLVTTFIEQFGGWIDFTSSPQQGTTFTVTLQPWN